MPDGRKRDAKAEADRRQRERVVQMASEFFVTVCPTPADELLWPGLKPTFEGLVRVALAVVDQRRRARESGSVKSSAEGVKTV